MSSTDLIKKEIRRFLASNEPEVLCLGGRWGVGKTFIWQQLLEEAKAAQSFKLGRYAYVSLFGLNSLDALRLSIFENTEFIPPSDRKTGKFVDTTNNIISFLKRNRDVAVEIPALGKVIKSAGPLFFATVRNQIVCIDDLERAGDGLKLRDVLGLISFLREQRGCKVALLLNDDELGSQNTDFQKHAEKVIDIRLKFSPTPSDSIGIALKQDDTATKLLAENCLKLEISNIRIIKSIERLVRIVSPELSKYDPKILWQAIHSLTLFGWSSFGTAASDFGPPSIEFLRKQTEYQFKKDTEIPPNEAAWSSLLDAYGYRATDAFDLTLMNGVQNGYFDLEMLHLRAAENNKAIKRRKQDSSFDKAWRRFHDSFDNNQDKVLGKLFSSFKRNIQNISLGSFDATVRLFKDLGQDRQAKELVEYFVQNREGDKDFWDIDQDPFADNIKDSEVKFAIVEKYKGFSSEMPSLESVLSQIAETHSWNESDITHIASLPTDAYVKLFKIVRGPRLSKIIRASLGFEAIGNASEAMLQVCQKTKEALRSIGQESALNARRVQKFGIVVDPSK